jgi:peptidoglycan/LPS O-acetylase OafA/YrhL
MSGRAEAEDSVVGSGRLVLPRFMPAIDGLRAFAVIAVVLFHIAWPLSQDSASQRLHVWSLVSHGWIGVDLFFVISGFLITGILLDSKGSLHYFRNFYIRRALRIWPLYYAVVFAVLFIYPHIHPNGSLVHQPAPWYCYAFYLQNFTALQNRLLGVTWSLAVEEQFYVAWPLVVMLLSRKNLARLITSLMLAAPLFRFLLHFDYPVWTFCRMDGILAGSLLALWLRSADVSAFRLRTVATCLLLVGGIGSVWLFSAASQNGESSILVYSFLALGFSGLVCFAAFDQMLPRPFRRVLEHSWVRYVGKISYAIYLFHRIVHQVLVFALYRLRIPLRREIASQDAVFVMLELVVVIAAASCSWWFFERPILSLKRHFDYWSSPTKPHAQGELSAAT